jgi:hypothetical protein
MVRSTTVFVVNEVVVVCFVLPAEQRSELVPPKCELDKLIRLVSCWFNRPFFFAEGQLNEVLPKVVNVSEITILVCKSAFYSICTCH